MLQDVKVTKLNAPNFDDIFYCRLNGRIPTCFRLSGHYVNTKSLLNTDGCVFLKWFSFSQKNSICSVSFSIYACD